MIVVCGKNKKINHLFLCIKKHFSLIFTFIKSWSLSDCFKLFKALGVAAWLSSFRFLGQNSSFVHFRHFMGCNRIKFKIISSNHPFFGVISKIFHFLSGTPIYLTWTTIHYIFFYDRTLTIHDQLSNDFENFLIVLRPHILCAFEH